MQPYFNHTTLLHSATAQFQDKRKSSHREEEKSIWKKLHYTPKKEKSMGALFYHFTLITMPRGAGFLLDRRPRSLACAQCTLTPAEGTEVPQVNSSFKAYSDWTLFWLQAQRQSGSQDCTWGHSWHQVSAKITVVPFALITEWHPMWTRGVVGRRKQSGEKKQKILSGISTSPCKSASTCICVNRATCAIGTGDYDSETTDTEAIAAASSDCLAQTWQPWKFFRAEI